MDKNFVHLHTHSDNSLLDGYGTIEEYINRAKELNMPALALTDHNTMTGIYKFIKLCKKNNIKPIAGVEFNMKPIALSKNYFLQEDEKSVSYDNSKRNIILEKGRLLHLTVLAKSMKGLKNLYKLIHLSYKEVNEYPTPMIDLEQLREHSEGLIVLSGCPNSEISVRLRLGQIDEAKQYASILKEIFKDDFYIEIMDYKTVLGYNAKDLLKLATELKIEAVMTNDVHYLKASDNLMQERFMAVGNRNKMDETPSYKGGLRYALGGNNRHFKSFEEMASIYQYEKMPSLLDNSLKIADKIETYELEYNSHLRPRIELPEGYKTDVEYLKFLINEGFKKIRTGQSKEIKAESKRRIKEELETIVANDFVSYFLVVWDYCKWANENGVPTGAGRGSAGGSEISYLLGIHRTDPVRFDLLFERFISPGRGAIFEITYDDSTADTINIAEQKTLENGETKYIHQLEVGNKLKDGRTIVELKIVDAGSSPDIDTDFLSEGRQKVIEYVIQKYGADKVASIITPGPFKIKNAWKSMCTIHEIPFAKANKISQILPEDKEGLKNILDKDSPDYEQGSDLRMALDSSKLIDCLEGTYNASGRMRETGVHPCGIVISSEPLEDTIPVQIRDDGLPITQWNYYDCEALGLIKMDFLGLDTIDLIKNTLENIEKTKGIKVDLNELINGSLDDDKTFELFKKANTLGIFQFAGAGVQELLRKVKPEKFDDLSAITALYRPGPMGLNLHLEYADRKRNADKRIPVDESFIGTDLEKILEPTYGSLVYQEQVMLISKVCAGFNAKEADMLRKAIGKKNMDLMNSLSEKIKSGMINNGYNKQAVDKLWDGIVAFGQYAFNKSHSTSYALNSYQSAYLKAHYPLEFYSALVRMKIQDKGINLLVNELTKAGFKLESANINESGVYIEPSRKDDKKIVYGLSGIKGISSEIVSKIIEERENNGLFRSLNDFLIRTKDFLTNSTLKTLAEVGAFDCFKISRKAISDNANEIIKQAKKLDKMKETDSLLSFMDIDVKEVNILDKFDKSEWSFSELTKREAESTGMFLSHHPLERLEIKEFSLDDEEINGEHYIVFNRVERKKNRDKSISYYVEIDNLYGKKEFRLPKSVVLAITKYHAIEKFGNVDDLADKVGLSGKNADSFNEIQPIEPPEPYIVYNGTFKTVKWGSGDDERKIVQLVSYEKAKLGYDGRNPYEFFGKKKYKDEYINLLKQRAGDGCITICFEDETKLEVFDILVNRGTTQYDLQMLTEKLDKEL